MARTQISQSTEDLTAQPTHVSDRIGTVSAVESGLSLDPEDIGSQFLSCAVEQGATISSFPDMPSETDFAEEEAGALGDALMEDGEERIAQTWERTIYRSLLSGVGRQFAAPPLPRESQELQSRWDEIDLTDEAIHEASLLDHEGAEAGEVEAPSLLRTDDTHTHGKRRGGHWLRR